MAALLKAARNRKLSPLRRDFDLSAWEAAKPSGTDSLEDLTLWAAGIVFHTKLEAFWEQYNRLNPRSWHSKSFRRYAIGLVNRNLREASTTAKNKILSSVEEHGFITPQLLTMKIGGALSGLDYALDDLLATSVDGLLKPLKDSYNGQGASVNDVSLQDVVTSSLLGQLHSAIQHLWEDCTWNGWLAMPHKSKMVFTCPDKNLGALFAIGFTRQMSIFSEMSFRSQSTWVQLSEHARWEILQAIPQITSQGSGQRTKLVISQRTTSALHGF